MILKLKLKEQYLKDNLSYMNECIKTKHLISNYMKVWVALYKGEGNWVNKVRRWTRYLYIRIVDDKQTCKGISPFITRLVQRKVYNYDPEKWDFYEIPVNKNNTI